MELETAALSAPESKCKVVKVMYVTECIKEILLAGKAQGLIFTPATQQEFIVFGLLNFVPQYSIDDQKRLTASCW